MRPSPYRLSIVLICAGGIALVGAFFWGAYYGPVSSGPLTLGPTQIAINLVGPALLTTGVVWGWVVLFSRLRLEARLGGSSR